MSKEVETILHKGDLRLPEELSRRVVVTCVSDVRVLRRKLRKQGSGSGVSAAKSAAKVGGHGRKHRSQVRAAKESCREVEVELAMTYSYSLELKVVNKFEFSSQDEDVFGVAKEEARKYAGWLIAQNKLAGKDMGKDMSNATLGKV